MLLEQRFGYHPQEATRGHRGLQGVTGGNKGLQRVTREYRVAGAAAQLLKNFVGASLLLTFSTSSLNVLFFDISHDLAIFQQVRKMCRRGGNRCGFHGFFDSVLICDAVLRKMKRKNASWFSFFNNYDPLLSEMTKENGFNSYKDDVICENHFLRCSPGNCIYLTRNKKIAVI